MKCPNCGEKNNSEATVCINCGADLPQKLNILLSSGILLVFYFFGFLCSLLGFHLFTIVANVLLIIRIIHLITKKNIYKRDSKIIRTVISVVFLVPFTPIMLFLAHIGEEANAKKELNKVSDVSETTYSSSLNTSVYENWDINQTTLERVTEVPETQNFIEAQVVTATSNPLETQMVTVSSNPVETQTSTVTTKPIETQMVTVTPKLIETQKVTATLKTLETQKPKETSKVTETPLIKTSPSSIVSSAPDINKKLCNVRIGLKYNKTLSNIFLGTPNDSIIEVYIDDEKIDKTLYEGSEVIFFGMLAEGKHVFKVQRKLTDYSTYKFDVGPNYLNYDNCVCIGLEYECGTLLENGKLAERKWKFVDTKDADSSRLGTKIELSELVYRHSPTMNEIFDYFARLGSDKIIDGVTFSKHSDVDDGYYSSTDSLAIYDMEDYIVFKITKGYKYGEKYSVLENSYDDDLKSACKKMEKKGAANIDFTMDNKFLEEGYSKEKHFDINGNVVSFCADDNDKITDIYVYFPKDKTAEKNGLPLYGRTWPNMSNEDLYVPGYSSPNGSKDCFVKEFCSITAVDKSIVDDETWYDCYDTENGDHYGWIKEKFLHFY